MARIKKNHIPDRMTLMLEGTPLWAEHNASASNTMYAYGGKFYLLTEYFCYGRSFGIRETATGEMEELACVE